MNKRVILILLSIVYLLFELGYRSILVDELSRPQFNPAVYEVIEGLGRLITSCGITLLLLSAINKVAEQWWLRGGLIAIAFMTTNALLKTVIQSGIEAMPIEQKEMAFYGYKLRSFIYNAGSASVSKEYLLTLPLSAWPLKLHQQDRPTLEKLVARSNTKDSQEYRAFLQAIVDESWHVYEPLWQTYQSKQTSLNKQLSSRESNKELEQLYRLVRKEGRDLFAQYRSKVMSRLYQRTLSNSRDYTMRFYTANTIITPTYDRSGRANETQKRYNRAYYLLKRHAHRYGSVGENHFVKAYQDASQKRFNKLQSINHEYGFRSDIYIYDMFVDTPYFQDSMNEVLRKNSGIDFSLRQFEKEDLRAFYQAKLQSEFNKQLTEQLKDNGLECDIASFEQAFTTRSYVQFVGEPCLATQLKKDASYLFDSTGRLVNIDNKEQRFAAMRNLNTRFNQQRSEHFDDVYAGKLSEAELDYYAKGVFVPVIVVFFANVAIVANFIRILILLLPTTKISKALAYTLFCAGLITPYVLFEQTEEKQNQPEHRLITQTRHPISNWFEGIELGLSKFSPITNVSKSALVSLQLVYIEAAKPNNGDSLQGRYWEYYAEALSARRQAYD